jgi:hypothetical protein
MGQTAAAPASYRDRRAAERIATSLRGKVFPGPVDCIVADFSKLGARVRFEGEPPAGARLTLVVWSSGVAFDAVVRWRRGPEIGLLFASSRDLRRPAPPHLVEIQALWVKRRPRVGRRALNASPVILHQKAYWPRRIAAPTSVD